MPATSCNVFSGTSAGIARVIGRVTGGEPSSINGTVTVSIAGADLFLINPAGLILGPNARLNVSGTVRLSTADYLKMADATQFHADLARPTVLSVAAVEAFGFLARPAAQFASVTIDRGSLQVPTGKTIAIVGGNIDIIGPHSNATPALQARSGRIELVSVTSQGEIAATGVVGDAAPAVDAFATLGTVTLSNGARILATPGVGNVTPGGQAMVRAHSMTVDASFIAASTGGNQNAPSVAVDLLVRDLLLLDHGSVISSSNLDRTGTGNAGLVRMKAGRVELVNGSNLTLLYAGNGKGSDLLVEADTVRVTDGGARVFAQNRGDRTSTGSGGTLQFVVGQDMFIGPGSAIRAENLSGSGAGSPIELTAPRLTIEGQFGGTSGAGIIGETGGFGPASSVVLSVGALELRGGDALINTRASTSSVIGGSTQPQGGGPITVQGLSGAGSAADAVIIRGQGSGFRTETDGSGAGGALQIAARQLELHDLATISAKTTGSGEAGAILLKVGQLLMLGGAQISSASALSTLQIPATGRAGTVTIEGLASPADVVAVTDSAILTSAAGTGAGGNITVSSQAVQLTNETISATANAGNAGGVTVQDATAITAVGSRVTTESSTGRGGTISLSASDTISLSNTTVSARVTGGSQAGGNITMAAGQSLIINQGTVISAQSLGTGDAGSITLDAGARYLSADSTVTTEATQASGGNIELTAAELIQLQESAITTSVFGGPNTIGGDIRIDPQFITMRNSRIIAQAVQGQGGNIIIQSGVFLADPNSIVDASSQLGINGSVDIRSPVQNLGAAKRPLSAQYLQGNTLLSQRCAAARSGQLSSFVVLGRDGVPPEPGGYTAGSLTAELARLALESLPPQTTPATQLSRLGFDPTDPFSGLVSLDLFATCKA